MEERRTVKRYTITYPIEDGKNSFKRQFFLRDISKTGMGLTASEKINEEKELGLRLFLKHKMFRLKVLIVYTKTQEGGIYKVGAKITQAPEDFYFTLEKEIEEITQFRRESNLYNHKDLSFDEAADEYLK